MRGKGQASRKIRDHIVLYLNGRRLEVRGEQAFAMLSEFLREGRRLTGTKVVCAEGDCGACTVLRARPGQSFEAVNACILPVALLDGQHILTIEALREDGQLNAIQRAMVAHQGGQCGFCTPGVVMALAHLFEKEKAEIPDQTIKNHLTGNLCRCTGYEPIFNAVRSVDRTSVKSLRARYASKAINADLLKAARQAVLVSWDERVFYAPLRLADAARFKSKHKACVVVGSATDLGVAINKGRAVAPAWVSLQRVAQAREIQAVRGRAVVGATATLTELEKFCEKTVPEFAKFLRIFASPQIKNVATLAGNVANGSPIGDTLPFLRVAGAVVAVVGPRGKRRIPFEKFYLGYRKNALKGGELIESISFEIPPRTDRLRLYKVSARKDLDISTVSVAFRISLKGSAVQSARIALGGVGATVLGAPKTEAALKKVDRSFGDLATQDRLLGLLVSETSPRGDLRGSVGFRRQLVRNLFKRFLWEQSRVKL